MSFAFFLLILDVDDVVLDRLMHVLLDRCDLFDFVFLILQFFFERGVA